MYLHTTPCALTRLRDTDTAQIDRHSRYTRYIHLMHAHAVFAARASFIFLSASSSSSRRAAKESCTLVSRNGACVSRRSSSSFVVATRAASGGDAGSSSSSSSSSQKQQQRQQQKKAGEQRDQKAGYSQNAAIKLLGDMESPWGVGTYHSKRATHKVNELGDIIGEDDAPENILEQPGWDDAGKLRFCISTVAVELDLTEEDVAGKLHQLFTLAPGIERRVGQVKVADIVRMAREGREGKRGSMGRGTRSFSLFVTPFHDSMHEQQ